MSTCTFYATSPKLNEFMDETTARSPITEFILQSERNLRVARAVYSEWEGAKGELGKEFCNRLSAILMKKLPGWECDNWDFLISKHGGFSMWKPEWADQYYVHLKALDFGETMTYGILRIESNASMAKRPFSPDLLYAVKNRIDSAKGNKKWWEVVMDLHEPDSDWSKPEVLWQMKTSDVFLERVASQLLELAALSEKIVDTQVAKYSGKAKKK